MVAVADKLGIGTAETVRKGVRRAEIDGGLRQGAATEELAEIKRLKCEVAAQLTVSRSTTAIRVARSRSSSGYFLGVAVLLILWFGGEPPSIPGRDSSRRSRVADITYCRTFARLAAEGPLAAAQQVGGGHGVVDREPQHRRVLSGTRPESRRPPPPGWVTGAGGLSTVSRGRPDGRRRRSGRPS